MPTIKRHKSFIKDISKIKLTDKQYEKYIRYIGKLLNKEPLPEEARDHELHHDLKGFREFHIGGDIVVVYKVKDSTLYLVRIGAHSQVFKRM